MSRDICSHAVANGGEKCVNRVARALGNQLNGAVGEVAYLAGEVVEAGGDVSGGIAEADTLHGAVIGDQSAAHMVGHSGFLKGEDSSGAGAKSKGEKGWFSSFGD
jgi:hypothetical protein